MAGTLARPIHVVPHLPEPLQPLRELAYNLWSGWNPEARRLFEYIDQEAFQANRNNPVQLLGEVAPGRLEELTRDAEFLAELGRVHGLLVEELKAPVREASLGRIAYFCAEYGLHESLPQYSGGLGILAGDTLKSASDLRLPLVAVGLAYRHGYFEQRVDRDGWQVEDFEDLDLPRLPMSLVRHEDGTPREVSVPITDRHVRARIWLVQVGRVPLYLLDTNLPGAPEVDRQITSQLYGGDERLRIEQEVLLGVGGFRTLVTLGLHPDGCHMNEGHSALLVLEQTADTMERLELSFDEALSLNAASNLFTTHTPVPAGNDEFSRDLIEEYLRPFAERTGETVDRLLDLGRSLPGDDASPFSMTVLGIRSARRRNGVSELHGKVSRGLWKALWPQLSQEDVPITHVTNGVHGATWIADEFLEFFQQHLGPEWRRRPHDASLYEALQQVDDKVLWDLRCGLRERMVTEVRTRLVDQARRRGTQVHHVPLLEGALDPDALTIGFCRRFATYKRATLLFRDKERLERLLTDTDRPVQFVFAGKAHPRDEPGKRFLQEVVQQSWLEPYLGRVVFVEGYDIQLARTLVQGVDVWLNTPQRPYEASGTSGMKVTWNGGLNVSILDGWWCEGFQGDNGWAVGNGATDLSPEEQDEADARHLMDTLESSVVPAFYGRDGNQTPAAWCRLIRQAMTSLCPTFHSHRMMDQYWTGSYLPALEAAFGLRSQSCQTLKDLIAWRHTIQEQWGDVQVDRVEADLMREWQRGESVPVQVWVRSGTVAPEELAVELVFGPADGDRRLVERRMVRTEYAESLDGLHRFDGAFPCEAAGRLGVAARIRPARHGADWLWDDSLVRWG